MGRWLWMTGGLVVWAVQFTGLYLLSSLADVVTRADDAAWRMAGLAFSAICAALCLGLLWAAVRRRRASPAPFVQEVAALSAGVGAIAVVWQALPTVIGY